MHINDPETEVRVRKLAQSLGTSLTQTINAAITEKLERSGIRVPAAPKAKTKLKGEAALEEELERRIRADTLHYTRLRNAVLGTKSGGSRVYQMLANHGPVETLRRLVTRPTDGLEFLDRTDAIDLAAEWLALDLKFKRIIPEDIRIRARANLAIIGR